MERRLKETYLLDGVHAMLESGAIVLRARRECGKDDFIYLEPETYEELRKFGRKVGFELPLEDAPEC